MTVSKYQIEHYLAESFAGKFIADHTDNDDILTKDVYNLNDEHLQETFKNCVAPLPYHLYELCRTYINKLLAAQ